MILPFVMRSNKKACHNTFCRGHLLRNEPLLQLSFLSSACDTNRCVVSIPWKLRQFDSLWPVLILFPLPWIVIVNEDKKSNPRKHIVEVFSPSSTSFFYSDHFNYRDVFFSSFSFFFSFFSWTFSIYQLLFWYNCIWLVWSCAKYSSFLSDHSINIDPC